MTNLSANISVLNGLIVLLIGLLCGVPLGRAILREKEASGEERIRAWRVAHSSLVMGGIMLLSIAAILPQLALSREFQFAASGCASISLYAFSYALVYGALRGYRGLRKQGAVGEKSVFYANMLGTFLSLGAITILIYGAFLSVLKDLLSFPL